MKSTRHRIVHTAPILYDNVLFNPKHSGAIQKNVVVTSVMNRAGNNVTIYNFLLLRK